MAQPLTRRQFHAYLAYLSACTVVFGIGLTFLFGSLLFPLSFGLYVVLPYYVTVLFLHRPELGKGDRWRWFSRTFYVFTWMREFLDLKIEMDDKLKTAANEKNAQFVIGMFPHGCSADFRVHMDGLLEKHFPAEVARKTRTLAASILFRIPAVREISLWSGAVDARKEVAEKILRDGGSFSVFPGGQMEQMLTEYGKETLYLKQRKGFVKIALKHGVPLVPCYGFGCSDYYQTSKFALGWRMWLLKNFGMAIPLATGTFGSSLCPFPTATTVVLGAPVDIPKLKVKGKPSSKEVDHAHKLFCDALVKLFEDNKKRLGYGDRTLDIQ